MALWGGGQKLACGTSCPSQCCAHVVRRMVEPSPCLQSVSRNEAKSGGGHLSQPQLKTCLQKKKSPETESERKRGRLQVVEAKAAPASELGRAAKERRPLISAHNNAKRKNVGIEPIVSQIRVYTTTERNTKLNSQTNINTQPLFASRLIPR